MIDYHAHPALGSSDLRNLLRSPAHYVAARKAPKVETPAMRRGTLAHVCTLEPERWAKDFVLKPKVDGRTKEGKAVLADFEASIGARQIVTYDEAVTAEAIAEAVKAHPAAAGLLRAQVGIEAPVFWADETTGVQCKGRVDLVAKVGGRTLLVDLKTTGDASPEEFMRSIAKWSLHVQAAHYLDGWRTITGEEPAAFVLVAVEAEPPHAVACYALDATAIEKGATLRLRALDRYCDCVASGVWPAYAGEIQTIGLPAWAA